MLLLPKTISACKRYWKDFVDKNIVNAGHVQRASSSRRARYVQKEAVSSSDSGFLRLTRRAQIKKGRIHKIIR